MRSGGYDPSVIESAWQERWASSGVFRAEIDAGKPKYYVLDMFPYPSGAGLHMGHPLGYTASDIYSRYMRLRGYNVLHPMGYDSFGLPAEQYAIQTGQHPAVTTRENVAHYGEQLRSLGFSYDWDREFCTSDPEYYRWTQWVFLQLYGHYYDVEACRARPIGDLEHYLSEHGTDGLSAYGGESLSFSVADWQGYDAVERARVLGNYRLAYRALTQVNWCEALGTVLANDEVRDGLSVRGGHAVVQRQMQQWCLRVRAYADRLLDGLDGLDWSDSLKAMQRNWIGRSEGAEVRFAVSGEDGHEVEVFTTRPDTIYGVTYLALAPEHPLVDRLSVGEYRSGVESYVESSLRRSERERISDVGRVSGAFTGSYALHPLTGELLPIWVADYVLWGYGTGAIMAVPAHDSRDFAFARQYGLGTPVVVWSSVEVDAGMGDRLESAYESVSGSYSVNSGSLSGLSSGEAKVKAVELLSSVGAGISRVSYRLRDAIFSRQRYWGEPIPIYYRDGVSESLPEADLPLELPEVESFRPSSDGEPPLARARGWVYGAGYPLETTTMPGFAGSSAYYLRFMDPHNGERLVGREANAYWRSVDLYIGGAEHATGHLIYSRFWNKFLYDLGYVVEDEPFRKLVNQGMIQGRSSFIYRVQGRSDCYVSSDMTDGYDVTALHVDVKFVENDVLDLAALRSHHPEYRDAEFILNESGEYRCGWAVEKMSKSLFNVVNPDDVVAEYGADTLRMYLMFLGPLEDSKPWDTHGIEGVARFLRRLWNYVTGSEVEEVDPTARELRILHRGLRQVEEGIERFSFNLCVSGFMIMLNELQETGRVVRGIVEPMLVMLSPFAPHIAEELWCHLGHEGFIADAEWPLLCEEYLIEQEYDCPVSFNGKTRMTVKLDKSLGADEVEKYVLGLEDVQSQLGGRSVKRVVVVPGRIVNIVF